VALTHAAAATIVVPTLGRSPLLGACLRALREEEGEVVLVAQGPVPAEAEGMAHRRLELPRSVGFATAVNLGWATAATPFVAVVNDDAVVEPGWLRALVAALEAAPRAAAAQGVNLAPGEPPTVDGWGLAWNRRLQAVQLGHGGPPPPRSAPPRQVFGVSATAALYRREALLAVDLSDEPGRQRPPAHFPAVYLEEDLAPPPVVFDPLLGSYYEDADLASRLRAAGWTALSVPAARARHAGAATAGGGTWRWRHVYGNRYAVAARLLGRAFWRRLPRMAARDLADLAGALGRGEIRRAAGVVLGWARAARLLPAFARTGAPLLAPEELAASAAPNRPADRWEAP